MLLTTVQNKKDNAKMNDRMPTLRKIKRGASQHTRLHFYTTFNFAQPNKTKRIDYQILRM